MDARLTADDVNLSTLGHLVEPSCYVNALRIRPAAASTQSIHFCFKGIFEPKASALTAFNQKTKKSGIENGFGSTRERRRRRKEIFSQQTYNKHKSNECLKENQYTFTLIHLFNVEVKQIHFKKSYFRR